MHDALSASGAREEEGTMLELIRARAVPKPVATGLSDDEVREKVRTRLAEGRLSAVVGVSKSHRGTGRPCIVCGRAVGRTEVEREVPGPGVVLTAHEACYRPWREESRVWRDLVAVGEAADRSGVTGRT
jgi:hypothetical protein